MLVQCVQPIDIYKSPGFPCDPLCPLWLKPLTSSPHTTDHADRGAIFNDRYFRRTTLASLQCRVVSVIAGYNNAFQLPPPSPVDVVNIGQTTV
jgi:hypothetical protein